MDTENKKIIPKFVCWKCKAPTIFEDGKCLRCGSGDVFKHIIGKLYFDINSDGDISCGEPPCLEGEEQGICGRTIMDFEGKVYCDEDILHQNPNTGKYSIYELLAARVLTGQDNLENIHQKVSEIIENHLK